MAETVLDFLKNNPKAAVFAKGSTKSRTRLYQMNIAAYHKEIVNKSLCHKSHQHGKHKELKIII